ncbi:MAG: GNAT family N-acetyltransferase [Hyphomicrobiaceae bacterium]
MLTSLLGRSPQPLRHGRIVLVEPARRHYEAWSLLRETSRRHLEPFEPSWAPDELSPEAWRRRLRRYRSDRRHGAGAAFLVERAGDGQLLGGVTLTNVRRGVTQSASVGYWIGLPHVRRGYATEALAAVLAHAFEVLELNRVEAACLPSNVASIGVLEKAGFRREGVARSYLRIAGAFQDHVLFALLRHDAALARSRGAARADSLHTSFAERPSARHDQAARAEAARDADAERPSGGSSPTAGCAA